jgi:hypothetical protein
MRPSSSVCVGSLLGSRLVVQSLGVVPAGADDVQTAELDHLLVVGLVGTAEPDVGAAAGHLRGDGDGPELAGFGDDRGLLSVVLGVEHHCGDPATLQSLVQLFGFGHVVGADQDGLSDLVHLDDVRDDRVDFRRGGDVDPVGFVVANVGRVRFDRGDTKLVELA